MFLQRIKSRSNITFIHSIESAVAEENTYKEQLKGGEVLDLLPSVPDTSAEYSGPPFATVLQVSVPASRFEIEESYSEPRSPDSVVTSSVRSAVTTTPIATLITPPPQVPPQDTVVGLHFKAKHQTALFRTFCQ